MIGKILNRILIAAVFLAVFLTAASPAINSWQQKPVQKSAPPLTDADIEKMIESMPPQQQQQIREWQQKNAPKRTNKQGNNNDKY